MARDKANRTGNGTTVFNLPDNGRCGGYFILGPDEIETANSEGIDEIFEKNKEQEVISEENPTGKVRIGPDQALYLACGCIGPHLFKQLDSNDLYGLMLYFCPVPLETIRELQRHRALRVLFLEMGAKFDEQTLDALSELPALREFALSETETDMRADWMAHIGELTELTTLTLHAVQLTDRGMRHLAPLDNLRKLDISANYGITNESLLVIAGMPRLEELDLSQTNITHAGLKYLAGLKHLETLNLSETFVTPDGIAWLKQRLPGVEIRYDGPREEDPSEADPSPPADPEAK